MAEPATAQVRFSLGVITDDAAIYPEVRKHLGGEFRASLASNEDDITALLQNPELHAILFDLDCIGDGPIDGLDVLSEIRKIQEDTVLVAFMAAYLASRTLAPGTHYLQVFRVVGALSFLAYGFGSIQMGIWMGKPWSSVIKDLADALIYGLLSAGVFGWLWPR